LAFFWPLFRTVWLFIEISSGNPAIELIQVLRDVKKHIFRLFRYVTQQPMSALG